jgi:uncharacterized pyridoxal phosphate-containing UPF0001 family protein
MTKILERYTAVTHRITQTAERAGREPNDITLVAVTKTWPAETVLAAYEAGMRHFGENRPEELVANPFKLSHPNTLKQSTSAPSTQSVVTAEDNLVVPGS